MEAWLEKNMNWFNIAVAVLQCGSAVVFAMKGQGLMAILMFLYALTNIVIGRM